MTFADRLKLARGLAGISARRLAELAGVSPGYPNHLETGRRQNPPSEALSSFARVLGTTMDWLLNGAGEPPTESEAKAALAAAEAEFEGRPVDLQTASEPQKDEPPSVTDAPERVIELDDAVREEASEVSSIEGPSLVNPPNAPSTNPPPPSDDAKPPSVRVPPHGKPIPTPDPDGAI
jgi:transcriptional regulator with XRE-family HTH domain